MLSKKRKIIISAVSVGAVFALAGVGYAAWVIAGADQKNNSEGANITAYTVTDKRISLTVAKAENDTNTIIFGKPADATAKDTDWLKAENDVATQDLDFHFVATVQNAQYCSSVTATIAIADANKTAWDDAVAKGYVVAPTITVGTAASQADGSATYAITGTFAWGEHFESKNPYTYYNGKTMSDKVGTTDSTYADDAVAALSAIYKLNGASFVLTVTANYQETASA